MCSNRAGFKPLERVDHRVDEHLTVLSTSPERAGSKPVIMLRHLPSLREFPLTGLMRLLDYLNVNVIHATDTAAKRRSRVPSVQEVHVNVRFGAKVCI
jgi:hypothetical protein